MARRYLSLIDYYSPEAPFATEFRRLLHRLRNNHDEKELKSLLITSATLAEGKSTTCSFLGITAAVHKGLKTLLIDCDMRRPNLNRLLNVDRDYGLVEILSDGFNAMDAIKKTGIDKLDIITSGRQPGNPSTVFDAEAIGTIIEEMKFYYDLILLDSPPVIPVSDPMLLSPKVDGLLLVLRAGSTQKEVAQRALDILDST
ncbi:MAG: CpsD/CapB family tyrosine-protein kinase, partial [candidate division Zixibacteria bacterium]|nr:CpsD/CapB family tyrosine-protein kinase [candidate division Zixibacteria bacterium]